MYEELTGNEAGLVVYYDYNTADANTNTIPDKTSNGFDAALLGQNRYGLHQVSYASFATREEASEALAKIKKTEAPEAWLLVTE